MLRIVESKQFGCLGDACSADEQLLRALHDEATDDIAGCVIGYLMNQVAEVIGRQE